MKNEQKTRRPFGPQWQSAVIGAAASLWFAAAPALAQLEGTPKLQEAKPILEWAIGAGFILLSLVVAFKNSKRSHVQ